MKQHKNARFQAAFGFLKQIEKFRNFPSKLWKISLNRNPDPPGKESWAKTRPSGSENVRIPGGHRGMARLGIDWYITGRTYWQIWCSWAFQSMWSHRQTLHLEAIIQRRHRACSVKVTRVGTVALPKTEGQLCIYQQGKPFWSMIICFLLFWR